MHGVRVRWNRKAERAEGIAPLQLRIAFQYRISYTPLSPTPCPSVLQLPVRIRPAASVPLKLQVLKSIGAHYVRGRPFVKLLNRRLACSAGWGMRLARVRYQAALHPDAVDRGMCGDSCESPRYRL